MKASSFAAKHFTSVLMSSSAATMLCELASRVGRPVRKLFTPINFRFSREDGGAIVEFVALAIPLFIPIFIYLNSFSSVSANEEIAQSMAREVLRVYVISESDGAGQELSGRAAQLLARQWKLSDSERATLRTTMDCSHFPCLTANGRIKLTLSFIDAETKRKVSASAQEHLSPWL
jgi:hypothetical protein